MYIYYHSPEFISSITVNGRLLAFVRAYELHFLLIPFSIMAIGGYVLLLISYIWQEPTNFNIRKVSAISMGVGMVGVTCLQVISFFFWVSASYRYGRPPIISNEVVLSDVASRGHLMTFVNAYELHFLLIPFVVLAIAGGIIFLIGYIWGVLT